MNLEGPGQAIAASADQTPSKRELLVLFSVGEFHGSGTKVGQKAEAAQERSTPSLCGSYSSSGVDFYFYSFLHRCLGPRTHRQCAIRNLCKMLIPSGVFGKLIYEGMAFSEDMSHFSDALVSIFIDHICRVCRLINQHSHLEQLSFLVFPFSFQTVHQQKDESVNTVLKLAFT